jgi:hypothetical protein
LTIERADRAREGLGVGRAACRDDDAQGRSIQPSPGSRPARKGSRPALRTRPP